MKCVRVKHLAIIVSKQQSLNNDIVAIVEWYKCLFTSVGKRYGEEGRPSIIIQVDDTKGYYVIFLFVFFKQKARIKVLNTHCICAS